MKQFNKTWLPDEIVHNGELYKINSAISGAMNANNTSPKTINLNLKKQGRKAILVNVLSNNLKGRTDLHGKPYQPTKWIFTND